MIWPILRIILQLILTVKSLKNLIYIRQRYNQQTEQLMLTNANYPNTFCFDTRAMYG
jgi:hypothetical protein